jgi:hypothetical protein
MKSYKQLAAVTIFAALACTGLRAQTVDLRATIPFDFNAGSKLMPAGEYLIQERGYLTTFHGVGDGNANVILMTATGDRTTSREARLDFHQYGSRYFLTTIWDSQTQEGRRVPPTAREKELAKRGEVPAQTAVSLVSSK